MDRNPIRESARGVEVDVLVVPNASKASVVGVHGDRVKIRVTSPPERNKANAAVIELMRQVTGVRQAEVIRGRTARQKTILLTGVTVEVVRERLTTDDRFECPC
ncbi:MAG: DUF167 domain-containing protein [Acidimicrobiia bacterium]